MPLGGHTSGLHNPTVGSMAILVSRTTDEPTRDVQVHVDPAVPEDAQVVGRYAPQVVIYLSMPLCSDRLWKWWLYLRDLWSRIRRKK
jgi:hypothetical protein